MYPSDLRYSTDHEWARDEGGGKVRMGISWFAQDALGDVVFVGLPEVGKAVAKGDAFAEVESTKSVSDIYAPVTGTVVEVNEVLIEEPEKINAEPYGDGWIAVIEGGDAGELDSLLDAAAYEATLG